MFSDFHSTFKATDSDSFYSFQEELLSPRSVVFIHVEAYFRCPGANWNETTTLGGKAPTQHERVFDAMDTIFFPELSFMESCAVMIEYYQRRRATFEGDLLRAVPGLMERLESQKNGRFFEELPLPLEQSHLFKALSSSARGHNGIVRRRPSFPSWFMDRFGLRIFVVLHGDGYGIENLVPISWITWYSLRGKVPRRLPSTSNDDLSSAERSK